MFRPITPVGSTPVSTGTTKSQQSPTQKSDRRKSLFAKNHRCPPTETHFNRMFEEIHSLNTFLETVQSNQQRIEVDLNMMNER